MSRAKSRLVRLVSIVALLALAAPVAPAAAAPNDNVLPGVTMDLVEGPSGTLPSLFPVPDTYDVYWVQLQNDQEITIAWNGQPGLNVR